MRTIMTRMAVVGFLTLAMTGCANECNTCERTTTQTTATGDNATQFVHVVIFDMKPDTPETLIDEMVADADKLLGKIPTVRRVSSGRRDPRMQRDINDATFGVGLVIYFDDKDGHDVYNTHALHQEYVAKYGQHAAKVRVFDFIAPAK